MSAKASPVQIPNAPAERPAGNGVSRLFPLCGLVVALLWSASAEVRADPVPAAQSSQTDVAILDRWMASDRRVDYVLVKKAERTLSLIREGQPVRVYPIALGDDPLGHKQFEGDERTPEGSYILDWRNPESAYHKSIHISYPNERDIAYAESRGRDPGGMIMIHGWPSEPDPRFPVRRLSNEDWTDGCIALTNTAMDEVWSLVRDGTPIIIRP